MTQVSFHGFANSHFSEVYSQMSTHVPIGKIVMHLAKSPKVGLIRKPYYAPTSKMSFGCLLLNYKKNVYFKYLINMKQHMQSSLVIRLIIFFFILSYSFES